jgi:hypothetical protein
VRPHTLYARSQILVITITRALPVGLRSSFAAHSAGTLHFKYIWKDLDTVTELERQASSQSFREEKDVDIEYLTHRYSGALRDWIDSIMPFVVRDDEGEQHPGHPDTIANDPR